MEYTNRLNHKTNMVNAFLTAMVDFILSIYFKRCLNLTPFLISPKKSGHPEVT
jgi:hypothetical protein